MFWQKFESLNPIFNKKMFSLHFFFIGIFANICIKNAQFNLLYQYMLSLTEVKRFSNVLNINKKYKLLFQLRFPYLMAAVNTKSCP